VILIDRRKSKVENFDDAFGIAAHVVELNVAVYSGVAVDVAKAARDLVNAAKVAVGAESGFRYKASEVLTWKEFFDYSGDLTRIVLDYVEDLNNVLIALEERVT
jgi:hypothetical protein